MQKLIIALVAMASLGAGLYFSGVMHKEIPITARVFEPVRAVKPFELTDHNEQTLTNAYFTDKWSLIFLGYTHCPDVCPTTLAKLANVYPKLKNAGIDNVQVLFVSVDPQRDTPERLKEYTAYFNEEFTSATGFHPDLFPFVRSLGLMYSMTEDTTQEDYAVGHSGSIVLVNPQGGLHAMFRPIEEIGGIPNVDMAVLKTDFETLVGRF
jgi:protein SCO1/2